MPIGRQALKFGIKTLDRTGKGAVNTMMKHPWIPLALGAAGAVNSMDPLKGSFTGMQQLFLGDRHAVDKIVGAELKAEYDDYRGNSAHTKSVSRLQNTHLAPRNNNNLRGPSGNIVFGAYNTRMK